VARLLFSADKTQVGAQTSRLYERVDKERQRAISCPRSKDFHQGDIEMVCEQESTVDADTGHIFGFPRDDRNRTWFLVLMLSTS
jgi:hypothetical protein